MIEDIVLCDIYLYLWVLRNYPHIEISATHDPLTEIEYLKYVVHQLIRKSIGKNFRNFFKNSIKVAMLESKWQICAKIAVMLIGSQIDWILHNPLELLQTLYVRCPNHD